MFETHLYTPIKLYFTKLGYQVKGEVKDCDIMALKDDEIVIIELKLHLNLDVILQAAERQKIGHIVYIAIPALKFKEITARHKKIHHLLRRLEIGLLHVSSNGEVKEILSPIKFDRQKSVTRNKEKQNKIIREFNSRKSDENIGGSKNVELMTSYREEAIAVAKLIRLHHKLKASELIEIGVSHGTFSILKDNFYGWFYKINGGFYRLTKIGEEYLDSLDQKADNVIYD